MVMIRNRKTVKGKLGKTRPKDTDFAGIARKQSRTKKTTTKSNRPTDARTATLRKVLKEKQKLAGKGLGQAGQAFLGGSAKQTPVSPKKKPTVKKTKPVAKPTPKKSKAFGVSKFGFTKFKGGGKASKYRMKGGGKTSKYRMKGGGKTSKYMARGGRAK
jgi:hypothetical protein